MIYGKWSEMDGSVRWGIGVGLAVCVVALFVPFEVKMVFFVFSLFAAVVLAGVILKGKMKEVYYFLADSIGEKWYGSKAQAYFLENEAGICLSVGICLIITALILIINMAAATASFTKLAAAAICMVVGAVIGCVGIGIKSAESDPELP